MQFDIFACVKLIIQQLNNLTNSSYHSYFYSLNFLYRTVPNILKPIAKLKVHLSIVSFRDLQKSIVQCNIEFFVVNLEYRSVFSICKQCI